jgi:hypothetical protein
MSTWAQYLEEQEEAVFVPEHRKKVTSSRKNQEYIFLL